MPNAHAHCSAWAGFMAFKERHVARKGEWAFQYEIESLIHMHMKQSFWKRWKVQANFIRTEHGAIAAKHVQKEID